MHIICISFYYICIYSYAYILYAYIVIILHIICILFCYIIIFKFSFSIFYQFTGATVASFLSFFFFFKIFKNGTVLARLNRRCPATPAPFHDDSINIIKLNTTSQYDTSIVFNKVVLVWILQSFDFDIRLYVLSAKFDRFFKNRTSSSISKRLLFQFSLGDPFLKTKKKEEKTRRRSRDMVAITIPQKVNAMQMFFFLYYFASSGARTPNGAGWGGGAGPFPISCVARFAISIME